MFRNRRTIYTGLLFLFVLIFSSSQNMTASEPPDLEVVTTVPVETALTGSGTKRAADVWVEMINKSKRRIDLAEFYLISEQDELLEPVVSALKRASERGVKIRFLIERNMLSVSGPLRSRLEKFRNLEITVFDWKDLTGGNLHAKYFVVDDSEAFIGSQNFDWRALKHIHETGLRIRIPAIVNRLRSIFEADWRYNTGDRQAYSFSPLKGPEIADRPDVILTASPERFNPPGIGGSLEMIKELIRKAGKRITVQLLNYSTDVHGSDEEFTELHDLLSEAAARGVEIKFAVSDWNLKKPGIDSIKALAGQKGITVKVFSIPEFSKGFIPYSRVIHSKVMRVDELIAWVGTSNWGRGYFYNSRNVEVVVKRKNIAVVLDSLFNELWDSGYGRILDPGLEYTPPRTN